MKGLALLVLSTLESAAAVSSAAETPSTAEFSSITAVPSNQALIEERSVAGFFGACFPITSIPTVTVGFSAFVVGAFIGCLEDGKFAPKKPKCWANVGGAVVLGALGVLTGVVHRNDYDKQSATKRDEMLPSNDTSLLDGYAITYIPLGNNLSHPYPTGDSWTHYQVHGEDVSGSNDHFTTVHSVHSSGRQRLTTPLENAKSNRLGKRDDRYTLYYAWVDGKTSLEKRLPVCTAKSYPAETKSVGDEIVQFGITHKTNDFCASLFANNQQLLKGQFAVLPASTQFVDKAHSCPG